LAKVAYMWTALLLFAISLVPVFAQDDKSLVEAYPLVVVIFAVAGAVGVLISILAVKALWRARASED